MKPMTALLAGALLVASPAAAAAPTATETTCEAETTSSSGAARGPRLGIVAVELTPELRTYFAKASDRGVLVGRVLPRSTAAAAGLRVGDVVLAVDGEPVDEAADIRQAMRGKEKGATVDLRVLRDGKEETRSATLTVPESTADHFDLFPFGGWLKERWWAPSDAPRA